MMIEAVPQMTGTLGATLVLLALAGWLVWLPSIGILSLGSWRLWLIAIPLLAYLIMAYLYGFFGDLSFDFSIFARSETARETLLSSGIVGFVEETLFRGIILYVLVRAWGEIKAWPAPQRTCSGGALRNTTPTAGPGWKLVDRGPYGDNQ